MGTRSPAQPLRCQRSPEGCQDSARAPRLRLQPRPLARHNGAMTERSAAHGIFLALGVLAAARAIDLLLAGLATLVTVAGLSPASSVVAAVAVKAVISLLSLGSKAYLLVLLLRRPDRLDWMVRSWAAPITLAVLAIAAVPAMQLLGTVEQVFLLRADVTPAAMGHWFYARTIATMIASWANAALWGGVLLFAYARARRLAGSPPAAT